MTNTERSAVNGIAFRTESPQRSLQFGSCYGHDYVT